MDEVELRERYGALQKEAEQKKGDPSIHARLGELAEKLGLVDDAINHYLDCVDIDEKNFLAYLRAAQLYSAQKKYEFAIPMLEHALRIRPNFVPSLMLQAMVFVQTKNVSTAKQIFFKILKQNPKNIVATHNLFKLLFDDKNFEGCEQLMEKALQINPNSILLHADYATYYLHKKDFKKGIELLDKGIQLDPRNRQAIPLYNKLFALFSNSDRRDLAKSIMEQGVENFPDEQSFKDNLYHLEAAKLKPEERKQKTQ